MVRFGSRKFIMMMVQMVLMIFLPIAYKKLEISDDILMLILSSTSALSAIYFGVNVWEKKKIE